MKKIVAIVALIYSAAIGFSADLALKDGRIFKDWVFIRQTPFAISIRYADGMATVPKRLLPDDVATQYPIDIEAANREKAQAKHVIISRPAPMPSTTPVAQIQPEPKAGSAKKLVDYDLTNPENMRKYIREKARTYYNDPEKFGQVVDRKMFSFVGDVHADPQELGKYYVYGRIEKTPNGNNAVGAAGFFYLATIKLSDGEKPVVTFQWMETLPINENVRR